MELVCLPMFQSNDLLKIKSILSKFRFGVHVPGSTGLACDLAVYISPLHGSFFRPYIAVISCCVRNWISQLYIGMLHSALCILDTSHFYLEIFVGAPMSS